MTLLGMRRQRGVVVQYQELEDEGPYDKPEKANDSVAAGGTPVMLTA